MLAEYVAAGGDPDRFWRSTPREVRAVFEGARLLAGRVHEASAWLAWRQAWASRTDKFPGTLDRFMGRKSDRRHQSVEEMQAVWMGWHAVLSGPH